MSHMFHPLNVWGLTTLFQVLFQHMSHFFRYHCVAKLCAFDRILFNKCLPKCIIFGSLSRSLLFSPGLSHQPENNHDVLSPDFPSPHKVEVQVLVSRGWGGVRGRCNGVSNITIRWSRPKVTSSLVGNDRGMDSDWHLLEDGLDPPPPWPQRGDTFPNNSMGGRSVLRAPANTSSAACPQIKPPPQWTTSADCRK